MPIVRLAPDVDIKAGNPSRIPRHNPDSALNNLPRDLVFLLTPQHTGTHFARMLLEAHPQIAFCVVESRRIDMERRAGYSLAEDGDGPNGRPNECMLDHCVVRHFHGEISADDFVASVQYCLGQRTTRFSSVQDDIERLSRAQFRTIGITPAEKQPKFLLFHGHAGPKYENASFGNSRFKFVITLRHPLLSVISALRRTNNPAVARSLLQAYSIVLTIPHAFFICVDLWHSEPSRFLHVFDFLGLTPDLTCKQYAQLRPQINATVSRRDDASVLQQQEYSAAHDKTLDDLKVARRMLLEGEIHPILHEWLRLARDLGLDVAMRRFGYVI
jgi:hypothetical protein